MRHRRLLIIVAQSVLIAVGYRAAFALRFDTAIPAESIRAFWLTLPVLLGIRLVVFARLHLFRGYWHHFGLEDLIDLAQAVTLSSVLFLLAAIFLDQLGPVPRSVFVLDWMAAILLGGGARFAARCLHEGRIPLRRAKGKRVLVVGAGNGAERLLRQLRHENGRALNVVALVDDDPAKRHSALHGVPVVGTTEQIAMLAGKYRIEMLVIAIPSATPSQLRRIVSRCAQTKLEFKRLPSLREMLDGQSLTQLADVKLEHLLARDPVVLDTQRVQNDLEGKVVLVTGGAGSVGSELSRQIARVRPAKLILFEQAESALYFLQLEIQQAHPELELVPVIGDVTIEERVAQVFRHYRPDYVFHAAAYKHVPMMETNAVEAVRNNVLGTLRVAECAARWHARKFVLISTDKAVNPSSIMGATKRIAERIVLGWPSLHTSTTDFRAVRFGNVLGSNGSVVPLFKQQLAAGGPITVTHPDVSRYFMTLPEAAQLVLQAAALPEAAGRIAMLEMGEPVKIVEMAEHFVRLAGLEPYRDVQIVFTGLRAGEKMFEELIAPTEVPIPTSMQQIHLIQTAAADAATIQRDVDRLCAATVIGDHAVADEIRMIVPGCTLSRHETAVALPYSREPEVRSGATERARRNYDSPPNWYHPPTSEGSATLES
ncbi:MAG TPA: nucleoside-diphosphate sugar epimerase/dehydratase [Gemmatimonadaceae bacterium]|nr:nucleoside-diphosphate sugar epimerase/dehydratase [Gemmatimonadaceae bacterium]